MLIDELKLEEVCTVGDGAHASIKRIDNDGIMYLTSKNFNKDGIILENIEYISQQDYKKHFKDDSKALTKPKKNDLIFSIIGSIGGVYTYKEDDEFGLSSSVAILRPDRELISGIFLSYYLKSDYLQKWIEIIKSGSAQGFLSLGMIKKLPLKIPKDIKLQEKIANILSNYDNLIENNNKRIKLLEEMAEEIYKEWFGRLRFPNYQNTKIVDGIPAGWEEKTINEISDVTSSKRIFSSEYSHEGIPFYRGKEITLKSKNQSVEDILYIKRERFKEIKSSFDSPQENDILLTAVGTIGSIYKVKKSDGEFYFKDGNLIWLKNFREHCSFYLYYFLRSENIQNKLDNISIGSSQKALTIDSIKNIKLIVSSQNVIQKFDKTINPILEEIDVLEQKNKNLKQTRDLLLPRLISGKLNIEDLYIK